MQTLSSSMTFFYKFVFLTLWSGLFAVGTLSVLTNAAERRHPAGWMIAVMWALGTLILWRTCGRFKRVALDGHDLVISNYFKDIRVPAREISQVNQNRLFSLRPVTLTFKHPTSFGAQISFMPPVSFRLLGEDEVVSTLRRLAAGGPSSI